MSGFAVWSDTTWIIAFAAAVRLVVLVAASLRERRWRDEIVEPDSSDEGGEPTRTLDVLFTGRFPSSPRSTTGARAGSWLIRAGLKSIHRVRGRLVIGRAAGCNIRIGDRHASRRHCEVIEEEGLCAIVDLGSRNGVYVNDVRVQRRVLVDGDVVSIGKSCFRFKSIH